MLTDELFSGDKPSLTDQLFAMKPRSLTDQLMEPEVKKPDVSSIAEGLKREAFAEKEIGKGTIQGNYMKELLSPSVEEFDRLKTNPVLTENFKKE